MSAGAPGFILGYDCELEFEFECGLEIAFEFQGGSKFEFEFACIAVNVSSSYFINSIWFSCEKPLHLCCAVHVAVFRMGNLQSPRANTMPCARIDIGTQNNAIGHHQVPVVINM